MVDSCVIVFNIDALLLIFKFIIILNVRKIREHLLKNVRTLSNVWALVQK